MVQPDCILVIGATGAQGGSVARHLLADGSFTVRAMTRNPDSSAAQALREAGAEIVRGDLADPASIRQALVGCNGVFGVTNFWEHFAAEEQHGRNLIDAIAEAKVSCFVFSTLPNVHKVTGGKLEVPHFDIKGRLEEYARSRNLSAVYLHVAFYYENFIHFFPPQKQDDGSYTFGFPQGDTPLAGVSVEDVGGIARLVFKNPAAYRNQIVGVVGDDLPPAEYARMLSEQTGKTVHYQHVPRETFAALGFPGAEDLANMFEYNRTYIPSRKNDLERCRELYPDMQSFEAWARTHRDALLEVMA